MLPVHRFRFAWQLECNIITGSDAFKTAAIASLNSRLLSGTCSKNLHDSEVCFYCPQRCFERETEFQSRKQWKSYATRLLAILVVKKDRDSVLSGRLLGLRHPHFLHGALHTTTLCHGVVCMEQLELMSWQLVLLQVSLCTPMLSEQTFVYPVPPCDYYTFSGLKN